MKKRLLIASVALLVVITLFAAFRGSLQVKNESGKTVKRIEISIDGKVALAQDGMSDGELIAHTFNVGRAKQVEIELTLGESCVSRGKIEPGIFANIQATIDSEGTVHFGETRFENSQVIIGSW